MNAPRATAIGLAVTLTLTGCVSNHPTGPFVPEAGASEAPVRGEIPGLKRGSYLTSRTDNDFLPAPSPDGSRLLFVSERDGQKDIFIKPLGEGAGRGSIQVTWHTADDSDPTWSPDGDTIGFASQREDPDGDLYLIRLPPVPGLADLIGERTLWQRAGLTTRLTDGATADRQPAWSPDGESIAYTSRWKGESAENVWILNPDHPAARWQVTWASGHDPAWTPDGKWVVFSSGRSKDGIDTDLWAIRISDGLEKQLTSGPELDSSPALSADGKQLVFTRFGEDTSGDGRVTLEDLPAIYRLDLGAAGVEGVTESARPAPIPLTGSDGFDAFPRFLGDHVVLASDRLSARSGSLDLIELPRDGIVAERATAREQMALARDLDAHPTLEPRVRILAYRKVLRPFPAEAEGDAADRYESQERIGELYLQAAQRTEAERAFRALVESAPPESVDRARAELALIRLERDRFEDELSAPAQRHDLEQRLDASLRNLSELEARFASVPEIQARCAIERGLHHLTRGNRGEALDDFRAAEANASGLPALGAEAAFERGRVYQSVSDTQGSMSSDVNLLERYRGVSPWDQRAAERVIATVLGDASVLDPTERRARLADLAESRKAVPVLPARALLEVGRGFIEQGEPERAREVFARIPEEFPNDRDEVAEARFQLANLAHGAGRWDEALEQYRLIQREIPQAERAYELARESFIRRSVEKGQAELAGRDPQSAIATFVGLVKYDDSIVEAHRGLVTAYATTHRLPEILAHYGAEAEKAPGSAVAAYALGLAHTYSEPPGFDAAENWLRRSVQLDPRNAFAHQTLGFVLEQRANREADARLKSELLNQALERYQAAAVLSNEVQSPGQRADVDLNLGNVYLELGSHLRAYDSYRAREAAGRPFPSPQTEAVFHLNFAKAAEGTGHLEEAERHARAALEAFRKLDDPARIYELADSLGLIYQELGRHAEAVESYREALELSRRRGDEANAFRALQNLAVNLTFLAESEVGYTDWSVLDEALTRHEEGLTRLDRGDATGTRGSDAGFAVKNVNVALAGESSSAATGFDEAGYRRLFLAFIARIQRNASNVDEAIASLEAKRAALPKLSRSNPTRDPGTATDHAILLNQIGTLLREKGDFAGSVARLDESLELCLGLGAVGGPGALSSIEQLALIASEAAGEVALDDGRLAHWLDQARSLREALSESSPAGDDSKLMVARAWNAEAQLERARVVREAPGAISGTSPKTGAATTGHALGEHVRDTREGLASDLRALDRARAALDSGWTALGPAADDESSSMRRARAILAVNRARLGARDRGDAKLLRAALDTALEGLGDAVNDDLRWRVLAARGLLRPAGPEQLGAGLADLRAAATMLSSLPAGALQTVDEVELDELFEPLASSALGQSKTTQALAWLDSASVLELAHTVGAGLVGDGGETEGAPTEARAADAPSPSTTAAPMEPTETSLTAYRSALASWRAGQRSAKPPSGPEAADHLAKAHAAALRIAEDHPALSSLLIREPFDAGDLQARLGEGELLLVPFAPAGSSHVTTFRLTADSLTVIDTDRSGGDADLAKRVLADVIGASKPVAVYLSPRGELASLPWESALPAKVPSARVLSLAHLATVLDARNVLREGHVRFTRVTTTPATPGTTEILTGSTDREGIRRALAGNPIVELALPLASASSDPLAIRPGLPPDAATLRRFTLADLLAEPGRRRALLLESLDVPSPMRRAAIQAFAAAGFPSTLIAPDGTVRARVVASLGEASMGEAVASVRAGSPGAAVELYGAVGFDADQAAAFAEERYGDLVGEAAKAEREQRWKQAADAFAEALSLEEVLDRKADRERLLFHVTDACAKSDQWARAVRFQEQAVALAREQGDRASLATALVDLGVFRSRAEDWDGSIQALSESAALWSELGRTQDQGLALAKRGISEEGAGRYDRALESFGSALGLEAASGSSAGQGKQIRRIGRIQLLRLNHYADAEGSFRQAQALLEKAGDIPGWIEATLEIGLARVALGDLAGGIAQYDEGLEAALDSDEKALVAKALAYRAEAHWLRASYGEAFSDLRDALTSATDAKAEHQVFQARNLNSLVRWSLNDFDAALDEAQRALEIAERLGEKADESAVHNNLGIIHRDAGRPARAIEELTRALATDRAIGSRWGEGYDLRNLGMTYLKMERLDAARDHLQRAIDVSRSIGDRVNEAKALVSLGDTLLALGRAPEAEKTFTETTALAREIDVREVVWRALWGQGRAQRELGRLDEARASLEAAVDTVEGLRAALKIEEMRNGFITNKVDLYEDLIRLLLDRGDFARAFDVAERSRARGFIDLLGNQKLDPARGASRTLLEKVRALETQSEGLRGQAPSADRDGALAKIESERRDVLTQIQLEDPALSSFVSVSPLAVEGVQKLLGPDTVLLAYFVARHELWSWVVRRDGLEVARVPIERADLERRVLAFRDRIQKIEPVESDARALFETLVRPLAARIPKDAKLGIVPHGILHYLSFAALHDGERYLVERHPLFYSASASVLGYTLKPEPSKSRQNLKVLAIGNPDLGTRDFDLPFAEKEVKSLQWTYPQIDILTGSKATKEWLLAHVSDYDVIHLASHGEFDPVNPLASALKLATAPGDATHGDLFAREVFGLDLKASMVTLSACQTGLGKVEAGDEVIGLNRAFLYAGTHSLLSSLWRVSDVSTAILVKHFYRNFVHEPRAESLRDAQLHVMSYYPHPTYWAGFVLSGDYR